MRRSVLVVEDYPDLRAAIVDVLSRNGCVCECAEDEAAIAKLRANRYEAILIGPRLTAKADPVLHYLIENQPAELDRVVVMTNPTGGDEDCDDRCRVLTKPFSRDELLRQVTVR
jgi:CheY-like chemotaxis protein